MTWVRFAVVFGVWAFLPFAAAIAGPVEEGFAAYQRGKFERAFELWRDRKSVV